MMRFGDFSLSFTRKHLFILTVVLVQAVIFCLTVLAADIAIFGDSQHNPYVQRKIVNDILQYKPVAVFRVGDMVNDGNNAGQWDVFREINSPLLKMTKYYPALGNHEKSSALYFKEFPVTHNKHWYSVNCETIHFTILDSNSDLRPDSEQYQWLVSDLKSIPGNIKFRIIILHHPLFNVGMHMGGETDLKDYLLPLFEEYGICAVFSGHDHNYQRFLYQGINFIVTGGGGSILYAQVTKSPYLQKFQKAYHFCLISSENDFLRIKVMDIDLNIIDDFNLNTLAAAVSSTK